MGNKSKHNYSKNKNLKMMKATFAMACFAGYVAARSPLGKLENNPQFVQFIAANNRSYSTHHELQNRARIFSTNQEKVRHLNSVSRASGKSNAAEYKIGQFGDYSEAEFREMSGWKEENSSDRARLYNKRGGLGHHRGGLGVVDATTVDHVKDGHMIGVKNQGAAAPAGLLLPTLPLRVPSPPSQAEIPSACLSSTSLTARSATTATTWISSVRTSASGVAVAAGWPLPGTSRANTVSCSTAIILTLLAERKPRAVAHTTAARLLVRSPAGTGSTLVVASTRSNRN